jgi:hypothetical protein
MVRFEQHIYGHAMPQGHRDAHLAYYRAHNQAVEDHFRERPGKLIKICWSDSQAPAQLAAFLGRDLPQALPVHENRGSPVYGGDNIWLAQASRFAFQSYWRAKQQWRRLIGRHRG